MTTTLSIAAIVLSLAAVIVAGVTARYNGRSAAASEAASNASDRSADAAKDAAESARRVAQAEVNRDHEMYRPQKLTAIFDQELNPRTKNYNVFLTFTPGHTYRVAADAISKLADGKESRSPLSIGPVIEAGRPVRVYIGELTGGTGVPLPTAIHVRFWPPAPGDPGEPWSCHCEQPVDPSGPLHWEWWKEVDDIDYNIMESLG